MPVSLVSSRSAPAFQQTLVPQNGMGVDLFCCYIGIVQVPYRRGAQAGRERTGKRREIKHRAR